MFIVSATSVLLALVNSLVHNLSLMESSFNIFLTFIGVLSYVTAIYGIRVLKIRNKNGVKTSSFDWFNACLLLISAVIVIVFGAILRDPLLFWFPFIGLFLGVTQILYMSMGSKYKNERVVEHLTAMLSCGVSAITAFVVFGAPRILDIDQVSLLLWFGPTIIIVPIIIVFTKKIPRAKANVKHSRSIQRREPTNWELERRT